MNLAFLGFSHRGAPIEVRESLALCAAGLLEELRAQGCEEAVLLSTCNRFELYLAGPLEARETGERALRCLERAAERPLREHARTSAGAAAARHLFEVASGLDSLVVGETEVLGQVKAAYEAALAAGMTGKCLNVLFQRALYVGKRVRCDTAISVGPTSVASVAVQLAESIFGSLARSEVLILGAGAMAELTARRLLSGRVARLAIANRTWERAAELAGRFGADAVAWERFPEEVGRADVVICSTGSPRPVLTREMVASASKTRAGRALFLIDIALPRDVEEAVHGLDNVYLYRLEDLETIVAENLKNRGGEVEKARALALAKAAEFSAWADSVSAGAETSLRHGDRAPAPRRGAEIL